MVTQALNQHKPCQWLSKCWCHKGFLGNIPEILQLLTVSYVHFQDQPHRPEVSHKG